MLASETGVSASNIRRTMYGGLGQVDNQDSMGRMYWTTRSSARSFARTARSLTLAVELMEIVIYDISE